MANITPGPWKNAGALGHALWVTAPGGQIACVYGPSTTPEGLANAAAIAAIPDLLAALHKAHDYLDSHGNGWEEAETLTAIREAMTKAEG